MFILDQDVVPHALTISTPEGEKKGVFYRGHLFTLDQVFDKNTKAASYCRSLLDTHILSIVTEAKTDSQKPSILVWREIGSEDSILSIRESSPNPS
jgi:hypothetical protein